MTVNDKIKTVNNKIDQNNAQCNLEIQIAKIFLLSSGNVGKNEFLTDEDEDVLAEIVLLEKASRMKRFEYSPLSSELKNKVTL